MAYRLVATLEGRTLRLPLLQGEYLLGSHPSAPLRLPHPSVSRRHATVTVDAGGVTIRDLGSRNGTHVDGRRVTDARLEPGGSIAFGSVTVSLERLPDDDLLAAMELPEQASAARAVPETPPDQTTFRSGLIEAFALERLPPLLRRIAAGEPLVTAAQLLGEVVFEGLPCNEVTVTSRQRNDEGIVFHAVRELSETITREVVEAPAGQLEVTASFPGTAMATAFRPLLLALARLVAATDAAPPPGPVIQTSQPPPLPDPPSVVPAVRRIYEAAARVAGGKVSVLVLGESGTGKEVLARYLHAASPEASGPFVALNCASLSRDLLESELFGIERGVATGVDARPGMFELADGGVLLLDEIGDMAVETQAKILRVLQSGEVFRLGCRQPRRVEVRVVAATNRDIKAMLAAGSFRSDLYFRIAGWVVELPPLRHRRADIGNLAVHFLAAAARARGVRIAGISRAALAMLAAYDWPGNVRQLANEMTRAALFLEHGELLDTGRLGDDIRSPENATGGGGLGVVLARAERERIAAVLAECGGNVSGAAARLGINRATLYRHLRRLGLRRRQP